ncbi:CHAT domain-containing protein [Nonomuraea monospora]|uniref:CHAT domain-containing protein n=1 Tax=Nonomuraea monospora TaxID=568818 RepID=A0ABN3CX23_9ACTN
MSLSPSDPGAELLRLAESDPARLMSVAAGVLRRARDEGDLRLASVAARALGIASFHTTDLHVAARHLRDSIRLAQRAGSPELAAETRLRLAFVWCVQGRMEQALGEVDRALPDLRGVGRARAEAQRAVMFNHLRRPDEALAGYRVAVPALQQAGDHLWLQRVLSNRGIVHGFRNEFAAAEHDLNEAERLCRLLGLDLSLAIVWQNLGWLRAHRGDVPAALRYLDLAEERFRGLDTHQLCWTLADRTELLLSAGLIAEAREAAEETLAEFGRRKRTVGVPEARLLLARTAYLEGDHERAVREARRAALGFGRQRRPEWAVLARFVALRSAAAAGAAGVSVARVERCAAELAAARWLSSEVEARMLAAALAMERGWTARAQRQLELAARRRLRGPAIQRVHAWHAEALVRLARGNRRGAKIALRTALRVHDEHRATLGATDLRAHASGIRVGAAELGLRMALHDGSPEDVLAWAEQGRARHLLMKPARPPNDPRLAGALDRLRVVVAEIGLRRGAGEDAAVLTERQVALEREIRDYCRHHAEGGALAAPVPPRELGRALGERALVEFVHVDEVMYAITVVDGRVRLWELGPLAPIRGLVERVPFALRRMARRHSLPGSQDAAELLLRGTAERLDALLMRPLAGEVGDRPLVVVPSGPVQALPWSVLPSCAGRPVCLSPSATLWHTGNQAGAASRAAADPAHEPGRGTGASEGVRRAEGTPGVGSAPTARRVRQPGGVPESRRVLAAAGPGLPGARAEAEGVASIHAVPALVDAAAGTEAVLAALDGAGLAHIAAHGHIHPTNPLFSSLRLADGPLTVYDLERLRHSPEIVILAACDSGRFVVRPGDELLGLSATFLALGTRTIVAPVLSILDVESTTLMIALHKLLAAGHSTAAALAQAQQQVAGEDLAAYAVAAGFVCMGADSTVPA